MATAIDYDNRGDSEVPFGFVYFDDDRRVVFAKGHGVSSGTGGWPPVTPQHVVEAQRYLTEQLGAGWND